MSTPLGAATLAAPMQQVPIGLFAIKDAVLVWCNDAFGEPLGVARPVLGQVQLEVDRHMRAGVGDAQVAVPGYCRWTPTECVPFFGKPVSSMIH